MKTRSNHTYDISTESGEYIANVVIIADRDDGQDHDRYGNPGTPGDEDRTWKWASPLLQVNEDGTESICPIIPSDVRREVDKQVSDELLDYDDE
jgi:hypothetical protein